MFGTLLTSTSGVNPQSTNTAVPFSDSAAFRSSLATQLNGDTTFNLILEGTNGTGSNLFVRFQDMENTSPFTLSADVSVIPEPSTFLLVGLAGLSMLVLRRRR
jgi:hypothetical protein